MSRNINIPRRQQQLHSYPTIRAEPPVKQIMNLKVLYTLDDTTTYLGRSTKPLLVRVIDVPNSTIRLGAVDLKKCLQIVLQSSPELICDNHDFSCYSKDISEPDEPYVGHGMISMLKDKKGENLIPGRVCTSFASLLGGSNSNETLEVKLKLLKVYNRNAKRSYSTEYTQTELNSSENDDEDNFTAPTGRYYKRVVNKPIKASRTKSLPASSYQKQFNKKISTTLNQRMNSIVSSSPIAEFTQFQEPKKIKLDEKKKPMCLECGTNDSKTWKIIKKPSRQFQYKTGLLCNDCNATMLLSGISPKNHKQQFSSSPSISNNLQNVDINEIFNPEYDVSRFGGPLTDIDPLPQQLTPVDDLPKATRLNTTLIDIEEDKENIKPISPQKPISINSKQTDFEKMILESFNDFQDNTPNDKRWQNVLFSHVEEDDTKKFAKTPNDNSPLNKTSAILSSPPIYDYKDDKLDHDKFHTSIMTSINDEINSLANWNQTNKLSPPTSVMGDNDDTEDEK